METLISLGLVALAGLLCIPVLTLFVEVVAALTVSPEGPVLGSAARKRVAVIVPAHNESSGIVPTIEDLRLQLGEKDRLVVVADNCSDDTAIVAEGAGAEVIVRNDMQRIGKGYALGWGIGHISDDPPDFVVFVDADCRVQSDVVDLLTAVCEHRQRPVQASFLMRSSENSPIDHGLAEFAFLLRNGIRPLGLWRLNLPVQLMGTGMIFPWNLISHAPLANGHLVEDLKLGLDLAEAGKAPYFCPLARVTSDFPVTAKGTDSQRQRWVQGHLEIILKTAPRFLVQSIVRRNVDLFALTLDCLVPPLSLLGLSIVAVFVASLSAALFGLSAVGLGVAAVDLVLFAAAVMLAWTNSGREVRMDRVSQHVGPMLLRRIRLYTGMMLGRTVSQWVRTDRGDRSASG